MKRDSGTAIRTRKIEQLVGAMALLIINLLFWRSYFWLETVLSEIALLLLPWLINGGFVVLAFIIRPQVGVGYLAGFFVIIMGAIALGALFVTACFSAVLIGLPLLYLFGDGGGAVIWCLFALLLLGGLLFIGQWVMQALNAWWFETERDEHTE